MIPGPGKLHADILALKARYGHLLAGVGRTPDPERDARFDAVTRPQLAQTSLDLWPTKGQHEDRN